MTKKTVNKDEMEITDEDLVELAMQAMNEAYAPYSNFKVGAALVTDSSDIFTGANVENASYGLTICAERVAVFKAVSEGHKKITKIAIVSSSGEFTYPCGACRQVLNEFGDNTVVITANNSGEITRMTLIDLLPHSFGGEALR